MLGISLIKMLGISLLFQMRSTERKHVETMTYPVCILKAKVTTVYVIFDEN